MKTQNNFSRFAWHTAFAGLCLVAVHGAHGQVSSINSAIVNPGVFNDTPGATRSDFNGYPGAVLLAESHVSKPAAGGLNRDTWNFSNNGGASAYSFQNNDYFNASYNLTLTGSGTAGIDLEAGWLFSNPSGTFGGDLQSIVSANGTVAQFGGPSYYPFSPAAGGYPGAGGSVPNYALGETYVLGLNYVVDPTTGNNAFQYSVNGVFAASSPGDTYFDLGAGVGIGGLGNVLGGYLQIGNDPNNANNNGQAYFSSISITPVGAPEPTTLALVGFGALGWLLRRRRN